MKTGTAGEQKIYIDLTTSYNLNLYKIDTADGDQGIGISCRL
jgi:hypothetical protein